MEKVLPSVLELLFPGPKPTNIPADDNRWNHFRDTLYVAHEYHENEYQIGGQHQILKEVIEDRVNKVQILGRTRQDMIYLAPSSRSVKPNLKEYLCPIVYVWHPILQFNIDIICPTCNNHTLRFNDFRRRKVIHIDGHHECLVARYKCRYRTT